jgi:hypothetical protein
MFGDVLSLASARRGWIAVAFLVSSWAAGQGSCPPSGLVLSTSGGRLGDPWSAGLTGTPGVSGLLGVDVLPGPAASPIGTVCLGLSPASGFPGALRSYALPSGAPGFACTLASAVPTDLLVLQGQGVAYLNAGTSVVPVNLVTGTEMPALVLGGSSLAISQWVRGGNVLYCLMPGYPANVLGIPPVPPAIGAIDTVNHVVLAPATFIPGTTTGVAYFLRYGPGSTGNALFTLMSGSPTTLLQIDPATGITTQVPVTGVNEMVLSAGGTHWLLLTGPPSPALLTMTPPALAISSLTPVAVPTTTLTPVPNTTAPRALMIASSNLLVPFGTDPAIAPVSWVTLPINGTGITIVVD